MKILIDARMFDESGIGRYIRNLIDNLQILDRKNEYFILHKQPQYEHQMYHNNFRKVLANFGWYGISEQIRLPKILNQLNPDLVHFPHFNVPIFFRGKFVVTIHDLIHQHFSMQRVTTHGPLFYKLKNFGYKRVFQHAVKKSLKIFTPSNFVKKQLMNEWGMDGGKIIVTPEAVDDKLFTTPLRRGFAGQVVKTPYIFYVGNAHPHKNVEGLIKVFLKLKDKYKVSKTYKDLSLVLSGQDNYFWQRLKMDSRFRGNDIVYTGYVGDEELVALYKNASCFVMPSFEEGFGIPLLESMACSCPIVSSNAGVLTEVGGDAALYFNPNDKEDMVDKIDMILKSEKLRKLLIEKGKKRFKLFSWKKLAEQTLEVYEKCRLQ